MNQDNLALNLRLLFCHNNLSDVDAYDLFSEMKVLRMTLPNVLMSPLEILELVKATDCYQNVSIVYRILLTIPMIVASAKNKFFKVKIIEILLEVVNVTRKIE